MDDTDFVAPQLPRMPWPAGPKPMPDQLIEDEKVAPRSIALFDPGQSPIPIEPGLAQDPPMRSVDSKRPSEVSQGELRFEGIFPVLEGNVLDLIREAIKVTTLALRL